MATLLTFVMILKAIGIYVAIAISIGIVLYIGYHIGQACKKDVAVIICPLCNEKKISDEKSEADNGVAKQTNACPA